MHRVRALSNATRVAAFFRQAGGACVTSCLLAGLTRQYQLGATPVRPLYLAARALSHFSSRRRGRIRRSFRGGKSQLRFHSGACVPETPMRRLPDVLAPVSRAEYTRHTCVRSCTNLLADRDQSVSGWSSGPRALPPGTPWSVHSTRRMQRLAPMHSP